MPTKKKPLPTKHKPKEKEIFKLVSKYGVSKSICIAQLRLPANYFNIYQNTSENHNQALAQFTSEVLMKNVVSNLEFDGANRKYLMQKLRVFDQEIELPIKNLKTAQHASQVLSYALNAYARKEISEDTLASIRMSCEVFSKLMTSTVLEEKILDLEKKFKEAFNA